MKQKTVWNPEDSKKPEPGKQFPGLFSYRAPSGVRSIEFWHSMGNVFIGGASLSCLLQKDGWILHCKKKLTEALQMEGSPLYRGEVSSKALNKEVQEDSMSSLALRNVSKIYPNNNQVVKN